MYTYFNRFLHYMLSHSDAEPQSTPMLSYSGLTRISRWGKFANWFDLDTPIKSECDSMGKDASLKPDGDNIENVGRSMVEMLGVLAIIGVLSVGAISGYSKAMFKYKLNRHAEAVNMLINNVLQLKGQLLIGQNEEKCYGTLFKQINLIPDGINYRNNCQLEDSFFNGNIKIYRNTQKQQNFGGLCFYLPVSSQGEEICRNILFAAKENADNLWIVELIKYMSDSSVEYSEKSIYGNNYCNQGDKCLYNMTLNDTEVLCNVCDGVSCGLCVLMSYK